MIAIRIDDVCNEIDYKKFNRLISILKKHNLKPLLGIIPDNQDGDLKKYDILDNEEFDKKIKSLVDIGYSVAMHGTHHTFHWKNTKKSFINLNKHSEFSGLSYDKQYNLLKLGKENLEARGFPTDIFMAPAHTFDAITLDCLKELNFNFITDGYGQKIYSLNGIKFIPCSISKGKKVKGIDTICLHPNIMSDREFVTLDNYIAGHRQEFVDFSTLLLVNTKEETFKRGTQHRLVFYKKMKSCAYRILKKLRMIER